MVSFQPQLVYTKIGTVNVVTLAPNVPFVSRKYAVQDNVEVELQTEGASDWVGATSLAICCGAFSPFLVIALAQASFARPELDRKSVV